MTCKYDHDSASFVYDTAITALKSYEICDRCLECRDKYFYDTVSIIFLNNFGGEAAGLAVIQNTMRELNSSGVRVKTRGIGTVASAAAVALSLGTLGCRDVLHRTDLQYHCGRVGSATAVTNQLARQLSRQLESHDDRLLHDLVEHIAPLTEKFATEDPRVAIYCWPLTSLIDGNLPRIELTQRQFTEQTDCKRYMSDVLRMIFEADIVIETSTAIALGLIDNVCTSLN